MELQTNRYNTTVPTCINELGTSISTPFYVSPTSDQKKALLNAFRSVKTKQLIEMGYQQMRTEGSLVVVDNKTAPQTPIELELGLNEENLRLMLFSRQGIQERLILQIQKLTGVTVFTKEEVLETFKLWLDHLFQDDEDQRTTKATKTPVKKTTTRKTKASSSAS